MLDFTKLNFSYKGENKFKKKKAPITSNQKNNGIKANHKLSNSNAKNIDSKQVQSDSSKNKSDSFLKYKSHNEVHLTDISKKTQFAYKKEYQLPDKIKNSLIKSVDEFLNDDDIVISYDDILKNDPMMDPNINNNVDEILTNIHQKNSRSFEVIKRKNNARLKQIVSKRYDARFFDSIKILDKYIKFDSSLEKSNNKKKNEFTFGG